MELFKWDVVWEYLPKIIAYIPVTLKIVSLSTVFGLLFGVILAMFRIYQVPGLNAVSKLYISFIRGTPVNIQLFIIYFGVPSLLSPFFELFHYNINRADAMFFVIATYALNNAAFFAELVRAAVLGVDRGQSEAALSIGLTKIQTFRRIVAPQAARIALPDLGNILVNLIKNTSLAYAVGIVDIMGIVSIVGARTHRMLEGYVASAIIYFILSTVIEQIFSAVQKKTAVRV